ncbi:unnamed protein product, partial [Penicillium egyptiacum]
ARRGSEGLRTDTSWSSQLGGFLVRKEQLLPFDEKQQPAQAHPHCTWDWSLSGMKTTRQWTNGPLPFLQLSHSPPTGAVTPHT